MAEGDKLHVVVFPWLAFGHMIPFLELSKMIAQKGHKVSFISTPRNIDRLPKIPHTLTPFLHLINLSLPHVDNIPQHAEATTDLPHNKVQYLKKAFDGLETELTHFLETSSPDWVIYDFAPYWLPSIAGKLKISRAFFSIFNAWSVDFFGSSITMVNGDDYRKKLEDFTVPPKWVPFPSTIGYRLHEIIRFHQNSFDQNVSGASDWFRFGTAVMGCDVFLIRSCNELEPDWLNLMQDLHQKPVLPVGLLPPTAHDSECDEAWRTISGWLDKQNIESVIYIALGSEVTLSQSELTELAHGLELCGLPFFWALRKSKSLDLELPNGFEDRIKDRGLVWSSWAPQLNILSHESVGGFLTHCGWSSVIEGLKFGRPLMMLPLMSDQGLNARVMVEKEVGVEIPRDEEDGSMSRNLVSETLRLVMVDVEGRSHREKAKDMKAMFGNENLHRGYIDRFVDYLEKHRISAIVDVLQNRDDTP